MIYPAYCTHKLKKESYETLRTDESQDSYGSLYSGVQIDRYPENWKIKMVYPVFLSERLVMILMALALRGQAFFYKLLVLNNLKFAVLYFHLE